MPEFNIITVRQPDHSETLIKFVFVIFSNFPNAKRIIKYLIPYNQNFYNCKRGGVFM